jgi:hypothetical protein
MDSLLVALTFVQHFAFAPLFFDGTAQELGIGPRMPRFAKGIFALLVDLFATKRLFG